MPVIVQKWEGLITDRLIPARLHLVVPTDEAIRDFINQSEAERDKTRDLLIKGIIDKPKIRDKQQYVQVNQALLIRLLDRLYHYKQTEGLDERTLHLYNTVSRHLETSLNFIEDFFSNYFDRNEKVPVSYFLHFIGELAGQLQLLKQRWQADPALDHALTAILVNNFNQYCKRQKSGITYNELVYQRSLMNELLSDGTAISETSVRDILFYFNFNDDDYVAYIYDKLNALLESQSTKREKLDTLRYEQKTINQLRTKLNIQLNRSMPPLKEQVARWIEEEIKYLEVAPVAGLSLKNEKEPEDKIHTSLSVAKLALLIRLMVIDKMIINRVVAQVLRITVKTVTTLQKESIAFGSLETKYHNPDRGTINAVKDMLFRWINILNKL
jgi:hypothetical protein